MSYDNISNIYDSIMSHVEYRLWVRIIKRVIDKYLSKKNLTIFEIGAGTGSLSQKLKNRGYNIISSDLSFGMCCSAKGKNIHTFCADISNLPTKKQFDLVIFLYDGINYLDSLNSYTKSFNQVHSILNSGGLFLFDITTKFNSVNNFLNIVDYEDFDEFTYIRHSFYNKKDRSQHNDFTIFEKSGNSYLKKYDFHKQYIFSPKEILSALPKAKFIIEGVWDDFSFNNYTDTSERVHFLLRKI